ncbi:KTSC domain-containing protein [Scopulibacillus cellulosilyticus]|uniref:KTSC domain-containing protein n=1 Tax=Scopulibacillus cellulosilyticus TaxID=2665665 RepID=A0ABW2PY72_9BACL
MNFTTFNKDLSQLKSFDTIGYDRKTETLQILFFDGTKKTIPNISEQTIFHFLLAEDKEAYYKNVIIEQFKKLEKARTIIH